MRQSTLHSPCIDEVWEYLRQWDSRADYVSQELALNKLFLELLPANRSLDDILLKVSTLNDFYGTHIFNTYNVASHIFEMDIDDRLSAGDLSLVNELAITPMPDQSTRNLYSFASKYCSHHRPENYAIYDGHVDEVLRYFRQKDSFATFRNDDLREYEKFVDIVKRFQAFYGLDIFTLKDIDRYLWQLGKKYFPKEISAKKKANRSS